MFKMALVAALPILGVSGTFAETTAGESEFAMETAPAASSAYLLNQWYTIWHELSPSIFPAIHENIVDEESDIPALYQRELFLLATNFDHRAFDVVDVRARYPFRSHRGLEDRLEAMTQLSLLAPLPDGNLRITPLGLRLVETSLERVRSALKNARPEIGAKRGEQAARLLERILNASEAGRLSDDPFLQRRRSAFRLTLNQSGKDREVFELADLLVDFVALRNLEHHRRRELISRYSRTPELRSIKLGPLADELISNAFGEYRNNREACIQYEFWMQTGEACVAAERELIDAGLVVVENGRYIATRLGTRYFLEAERIAELHFYSGWSALSGDEVRELDSLLDASSP